MKKKIRIKHNDGRSLLSEFLPYEIALPFNNKGLFALLRKLDFRWHEDNQFSVKQSAATNQGIQILEHIFRKTNDSQNVLTQVSGSVSSESQGHQTRQIYKISDDAVNAWRHPLFFEIDKPNGGSRQLCILHPASMLLATQFLKNSSETILYYCNRSPYSLRHPVSVANLTYSADALFKEIGQDADIPKTIEMYDKEQYSTTSFFSYRKYRNIYDFYASHEYHGCERKYPVLKKTDISQCFNSIYTHSFSWATNGWKASKEQTGTKKSFGGRLDSLLQHMNYGETHGITIGPEFSRICAEVILQEVDAKVYWRIKNELLLEHSVNYDIRRYVDDYFIFARSQDDADGIYQILQQELRNFRLQINEKKTIDYVSPFPAEITIAKNQISQLVQELFSVNKSKKDTGSTYWFFCDTQKVILEYKRILLGLGVLPNTVANYFLSAIERSLEVSKNKIADIIEEKSDAREKNHSLVSYSQFLTRIVKLAFFIFSGNPKASLAIKVVQIAVLSKEILQGIKANAVEQNLLSDEVKNNITTIINSTNFTSVTILSLIDCMTTFDSSMDEAEIDVVIQRLRTLNSNGNLNAIQLLILLRHCGKLKLKKAQTSLLDEAKKLMNDGDPRHQTDKLLLTFSLIGDPYLQKEQLNPIISPEIVQEKNPENQRNLEEIRSGYPNIFFDWEIDNHYYESLLDKQAKEVY